MRVPRIPFDGDITIGARIELPAETSHHLLRVLRLPAEAEVRLFNGAPGDWSGRLVIGGKRAAAVDIDGFVERVAESTLGLTLVQGLSRGQRMDYTLEKSVELGVGRIEPVIMARSQAVPQGARIERKTRHWSGVVASAASQSGRTRLPTLAGLCPFADWLASAPLGEHPHVLLDPEAETGPDGLGRPGRITLLAGPEGGFTPAERQAAVAAGCRRIRLGPRILRTETAAVAALAVLQALYGDFV